MNTTEIVVRAADPDDAVAISMAVRNGLGHFGFDNVSNSVVGANDADDPELMEMLGNINPELQSSPIDIVFEPLHPAGSVDTGPEEGFSEPDGESDGEEDDD